MDPIEPSAVAPRKSMWARALAQLFRAQTITGRLSQDEGIQAQISNKETNKDPSKTPPIIKEEEEGVEVWRKKVEEAFVVNRSNEALERRLNSSRQFPISDNTELSALKPTHFITCLSRALRSITSFVRLMMGEMESANWDLSAAASSIQPGVSFWEPNHKVFVFESFVCAEKFEGFNVPYFRIETESADLNLFFGRYNEMRSVRPEDYLARKPESKFATFCGEKYLKLVHPEMELSFFGNLNHRNSVTSNELPNTPFFRSFVEMPKRVWLLHCLAFSYIPEVSIFRVSGGTRFSEVCMESLSDEASCSSSAFEDEPPRVAFVVAPGFEIGNTVIQCKVYLC